MISMDREEGVPSTGLKNNYLTQIPFATTLTSSKGPSDLYLQGLSEQLPAKLSPENRASSGFPYASIYIKSEFDAKSFTTQLESVTSVGSWGFRSPSHGKGRRRKATNFIKQGD